MEDRKLDLDLDWTAEFEDPSLEESLQVEADTRTFYRALKHALNVAEPDARIEAA